MPYAPERRHVAFRRGFRLVLVGPATVVQHPEIFDSPDKAERVQDELQRQLPYGRDLVGHDWELANLFPCGRKTIAYLPSVKVQASTYGRNGSAFRYNYFISDADLFAMALILEPGTELRVTATAASYQGRLQWSVNSMEWINKSKDREQSAPRQPKPPVHLAGVLHRQK